MTEGERRIYKAASFLKPLLRKSVTPIAVQRGDQLSPWGTGTFFRIADDSFLITAGHVWTKAKRMGIPLYAFGIEQTTDDELRLRAVLVKGKIVWSNDPFDVAFIEMEQEMVESLPKNQFLRLTDVRLRPVKGGRCWVFGFPTETFKRDPASNSYHFHELVLNASLHDDEDAALENYDPRFHFLVHLDRSNARSLREGAEPRPAEFPDLLDGISGSSVWQTSAAA